MENSIKKNEKITSEKDPQTLFKDYLLKHKFYKSPTTQVPTFNTGSPLFAFMLFQDLLLEPNGRKARANLTKYRASYQDFLLNMRTRKQRNF